VAPITVSSFFSTTIEKPGDFSAVGVESSSDSSVAGTEPVITGKKPFRFLSI
jgi:hypothetical protein